MRLKKKRALFSSVRVKMTPRVTGICPVPSEGTCVSVFPRGQEKKGVAVKRVPGKFA